VCAGTWELDYIPAVYLWRRHRNPWAMMTARFTEKEFSYSGRRSAVSSFLWLVISGPSLSPALWQRNSCTAETLMLFTPSLPAGSSTVGAEHGGRRGCSLAPWNTTASDTCCGDRPPTLASSPAARPVQVVCWHLKRCTDLHRRKKNLHLADLCQPVASVGSRQKLRSATR